MREPIPAAPGRLARVDYEYCRNGTVNLFVAVDAHRSWRKVSVTKQAHGEGLRRAPARARGRGLPRCRVHSGSCRTTCPPTRRARSIETFPAAEAHRILERLEFHYTPSAPGAWLDVRWMGVLKGQCLDVHVDDQEDLEGETPPGSASGTPPAHA